MPIVEKNKLVFFQGSKAKKSSAKNFEKKVQRLGELVCVGKICVCFFQCLIHHTFIVEIDFVSWW